MSRADTANSRHFCNVRHNTLNPFTMLKRLNPVSFVKDSLSFMEGYSRLYVWLFMPVAYARLIYFAVKG